MGRSTAVTTLLLLVFFVFLVTGCRPPEGDAQSGAATSASDEVSVIIELTEAAEIGEVPVRVTARQRGEPVEGATVQVVGDMTHAGMEPVVADAVETEPGVYVAEEFGFTMAGDWVLTATLELAGGESFSGSRELSVNR